MTSYLANFVYETANAPGTGTINLGGAATGRNSFLQAFPTASVVYYFLDDGTQAEAGYGTLTAGSPNTLSRDTVLWNTSGTTSKLNFTGACRVFNTIPAGRAVYMNPDGTLNLNGTTNTFNGAVTIASGYGLTVTSGNLTLSNGNINVTGSVTASAGLTINGGTITLGGNVSITGTSTLTVGGVTNLNGNTSVGGSSTLTVGGKITGNAGLTIAGGGASITGDLTMVNSNVKLSAGYSCVAGTATYTGGSISDTSGNFLISDTRPGVSYARLNIANTGSTTLLFGVWTGTSFPYDLTLQADRNMVIHDTGTAVWNSGTSTSDKRLKKINGNLSDALAVVKQLPVVRYNWNDKSPHKADTREWVGFLAQDVQALHPQAVQVVSNGEGAAFPETYMLHKEELVPLLWRAIQQLSDRLDALTPKG